MDPSRFDKRRLRFDALIGQFFGANALVAIVVLALITLFFVREGAGFFGQNLQSLRVYRLAGLEYVDKMRGQVEGHTALARVLMDMRVEQVKALQAEGRDLEATNAALVPFDAFFEKFDDSVADLRGIASDLTEVVTATKQKVEMRENALKERAFFLKAGRSTEAERVSAEALAPVDFRAEIVPVQAMFPEYQKASEALGIELLSLVKEIPPLAVLSLEPRYERFVAATKAYVAHFPVVEKELKDWQQFEPVPWYRSVTSFLFGKQWVTNSFWQDYYGVLPLVTGSLLVAGIAMVIAIPFGVAAAIYVSEIASPAEKQIVKPYIEFISAIPSVVLGFFGIVVLGEAIRTVSQWEWLAWLPGFPISERLNAFTAGCLLALMAVPTIFTLAEDAISSVPRAFKEASYAMGATRLQTILRVLVPAATSGIISAVLLGFGRVIGETMVVLLCAGNRIQIPGFSSGIATIFEPVHTMTGIIAQEMGEVVRGSIQYRALFMVGLLLFVLALVINGLAQAAVRRFKGGIQ